MISRQEKLYMRLSSLELEYLELLVKILGGENMGFSSLAYFWRKNSTYRVGKKWGNDGVDHLERLEKEIRQMLAKLDEPISGSVVGVIEEYAAQRSNSGEGGDDKALERAYHERLTAMLAMRRSGRTNER